MKNVFGILLFCSLGFSQINPKIDHGYPVVRADKMIVGKSVFKNGFFALDKTSETITAAEVQVDTTNSKLTIKWYQFSTLAAQNVSLRYMLSTRKTGLSLVSIVSPILDIGSNNITRNPLYVPQFTFTGNQVQATKDPFIPAHEAQYTCIPNKNACFQIGAESTHDSKVSVMSSGDGSTLSFVTDYQYSFIKAHQIVRCSVPGTCLNSSPEKLKYRPVVVTEINLSQFHLNYMTHLADIIDRTLTDYGFVLNNLKAIVAAGKACQLNVSMQVETRLQSEMIENIRGNGVDDQCFKTQLSTLRNQYLPQEMQGFTFSQEQVDLGKTFFEIESNCPFENWVGPRNRYKLLNKECVAAGIQRLELKTRKIHGELVRYTK